MTSFNTDKKAIIAWCLYDWSSSGFPIIITTFIFATYFTTKVAVNEITGTYQWANASAISGLIIAILSPLFGAIADHGGHHKRWLFFFTIQCIFGACLLWFALPNSSYVFYTLSCVVIGTVGLELALVFYNSFLPHIVPYNYIGRISGWGWGCGYFGGIVILTIALFGFVKGGWMNHENLAEVRICGPLVGLWYFIFSMPLFFLLKDIPSQGLSIVSAIRAGLKDLVLTIKTLPREKNLFIYLVAHLIYIDGLNTLFAFGGIYAAGTFKMTLTEVILFGISMNIAAGFGAVVLAWIDDFIGSKFTILLSLISLMVFGIFILLVHSATMFWVVGLCLSLFFGPVQAASRSLMARLVKPSNSTELFGLYSFSGRITSFMGPWLLGAATLHFGTQRAGMATILLFFLMGGILMLFVREAKKS